MKTLFAIALLALLPQDKLPESVKRAQAKLSVDANDPEANLTVGKYRLSLGQYEQAIEHFAKGSDADLKALAFKDFPDSKDPLAVASEWLALSKKNAALKQPMIDRAVYWYGKAWQQADDKEKVKLRAVLYKLAAPPAGYEQADKKTELAVGWEMGDGIGSYVEPAFSHSGKKSLKLLPTKGKNRVYANSLTVTIQPEKKYTASLWIYSDKTDLDGNIDVAIFDNAGKQEALKMVGVTFPSDSPFWQKVSVEVETPAKAGRLEFRLYTRASAGAVWIDDVSLVSDGRDYMKNGGFEDKK